MESPQVWFFDILRKGSRPVKIDPTFLDACEDGSIVVQSVTSDKGCEVGAWIDGDTVHTSCLQDAMLTVTIAGIRKGRSGVRFPRHTEEQMYHNNKFWDQASLAA
jgi:hypothetical protein